MQIRMSQLIHLTAATALVATTLSACGADELSDEEYRAAVPNESAVTIQAPEQSSSALSEVVALGEQSEYYVMTRNMSRDVNGNIRGLLLIIKAVMQAPATTREENRRIWGPGADALDPVYYRLTVTREAEGQFSYVLDARPKAADDLDANYFPLVSGTADVTSGERDGAGTMVLHVGNFGQTDGNTCAAGVANVSYDTTSEPQYLSVAFVDFATECGTPATQASYYYDRAADGSGNFQFAALGDIQNGAIVPAVPEIFAIRSRWHANGEGRSDVQISGGDLEAQTTIATVSASECWSEYFALTYASIDPQIIDPSRNLGAEADCAAGLQSAEYATDVGL
ncbi:MAG: hypothetical protein AAB426_15290 [Myxococcota bacterium]